MTEQTKPTDVFTNIANDILSDLEKMEGISVELMTIRKDYPDSFKDVVNTVADKIHNGITTHIATNFFNGPNHDPETNDMKILSITDAKDELKNLFNRNMEIVASE